MFIQTNVIMVEKNLACAWENI